mmetsp:Transcript_22968/g.68814  ORF Transcript_22968/g.68814 Transcript_22968/m.68814 type:complete len:213 (-) Transcript_22968:189-827(-)
MRGRGPISSGILRAWSPSALGRGARRVMSAGRIMSSLSCARRQRAKRPTPARMDPRSCRSAGRSLRARRSACWQNCGRSRTPPRLPRASFCLRPPRTPATPAAPPRALSTTGSRGCRTSSGRRCSTGWRSSAGRTTSRLATRLSMATQPSGTRRPSMSARWRRSRPTTRRWPTARATPSPLPAGWSRLLLGGARLAPWRWPPPPVCRRRSSP